jgi:hypothetical protein
MIPLSAKQIVRVPLDRITYLVVVPTLFSRAEYRRDVQALGAVYHSDETMLNILRDGVRECVAADQQAVLLEIINSFEIEQKRLVDLGDDTPTDEESESLADLRNRMEEIEQFVRREYDKYNSMSADRSYWLSIAPIVAFREFVKGWEGGEKRDGFPLWKQRSNQVCEDVMEYLPPEHIDAVGWKAIMLMSPTGGQEKNSESQSQSAADQETSIADDSPQTTDPAGT